MGRKVYTNSLAGGEMSPLMLGHIEDEGLRTGWAEGGRNMIALPTGPATKRPPFEFVRQAKTTGVRLFPFVYGDGDAYAMEWGPTHTRFFADGEALFYATPIPVASVDLGTDTFTTVEAHGLAVNDPVRVTHIGVNIPGNLATGSTYYVRTVPTTTTFTLSATAGPGALLDLITHSTIDETSFWLQEELPREYITSKNAAGVSTLNDTVNVVGHQLTFEDPVHFTVSGGTIIVASPPIVPGTVYYIRPTDADNFTVHPTKEDADADTNALDITGAGTGTTRVHYAYYRGDIVWGGSLTLSGSTSSRLFWCAADLTEALPTVADWHQMPADGVYELLHGLGASGLADLNYDQSLDVWTFASEHGPAYTLGREVAEFPSGSSATVDVIRWVLRAVDPSPVPAAPVLTLSSRVFGEYYTGTIGNGSFLFIVNGTTNHALLAGDVVYLESSIGDANAISSITGTPGFFLVTTLDATNPSRFQLRRITAGAAEVSNSSGVSQNFAVRNVGSSSRTAESYVVTALIDGEESQISNVITATNNLQVPGSSNVLTWTAVEGAQRYRLYKELDEVYGLIGETDQLTLTDDDIGPDLAFQPPTYDDALETEDPRACARFQQRPWFGGSVDNPRRVWGGVTGTLSTMSYHERVLLDTDRIELDVAARERTLVRHLVPMTRLMVMTSSAEIRLGGPASGVLSPVTPIEAESVSQVGCTGVRPVAVNSNLLFVGARNQHVYELQPQQSVVQPPSDLSIRASHLFDGYEPQQSAQQDSPVPIEWFVRDDGSLLGITYMPEQNIRGWHLHSTVGTDATIDSVCVIPDSDGQRLYAAITRTIDSVAVTYIERMGRIEAPANLTACKYLDSCVTYEGASTVTIPVPHLEGEEVYCVADGRLQGPFTVASGVITLDRAATTAHTGLLYDVRLPLLPPTLLVEGFGKGRQLNVGKVALRVDNSCAFDVAGFSPSDEEFAVTREAWPANGVDNYRLRSATIEVAVDGGWDRDAQAIITQESPFPLTIVSVTHDVSVGGPD